MSTMTLGELTVPGGIQTGPFGSQLHAHDYVDDGVGVVMPQDITSNALSYTQMARISADTADGLSRHKLQPGDIVYSRRGDITRRSLIRAHDSELICGTGCLRVRIDECKADPTFVSYLLGQPAVHEWLRGHAVGATMPNLNTSILSNLPLTLPSLFEQQAIGEVLGALDDKIAANRTAALRVAELQRVLWAEASAPAAHVRLVDVVPPHLGGTPDRADAAQWGGDIAWASVADMSKAELGVVVATNERIADREGMPRRLAPLPIGTTFLSARGTVGLVTTNAMPCAINQSAYAFCPSTGRSASLRLAIELSVDELKSKSHGSVFSTITMSTLGEILVPEILLDAGHPVHARLEKLEQFRLAMATENRTLAATRDELLPLLMDGRITVKTAEKTVEGVL